MKKQNVIILILCILLATVIVLSVLGVIGPQGSFTGFSGDQPTVTPRNTDPLYGTIWDPSEPTYP